MSQFTVKRGVIGGDRVCYECPRCKSPLETLLSEAGTQQKCPNCGHSHSVPGFDELRKRAIASERERVRAEEAKRYKAGADRIGQIERDAKTKLAGDLHAQAREERDSRMQADGGWADRFLAIAFALAKYVSVLIVLACFAAMGFFLVALIGVKEKNVPQPAGINPPTWVDYRDSLRPRDSEVGARSNPPPDATPLPIQPDEQRLDRILIGTGLAYEIKSNYRFWYGLDHPPFLDALEVFVRDAKAARVQISSGMLQWFVNRYDFERRFAEDRAAEAAREVRFERESVIAKRTYRLTMFGTSLATLLTFLFLPLAIQIERNTRKLNKVVTEASG